MLGFFFQNVSHRLSKIFPNGVDISSILGSSSDNFTFKFSQCEEVHVDELRKQLEIIIKEIKTPITIVLDEFPELIWKFGQDKPKEDQVIISKEQTSLLLSGLRALRQEIDGKNSRHKIIIAGSVNLPITLSHLGLDNLINDIEKISISNISPEQSVKLFNVLVQSEDFKFASGFSAEDFIKKQFGFIAPFYIQVFANSLYYLRMNFDNGYVFTEEDLVTCYKELMLSSALKYFNTRISRFYANHSDITFSVLKKVAMNQFQNKIETTEEECFRFAEEETNIRLNRKQQAELVAQMKSDDLIQVKGHKYYFASTLICNFWHYTLVDSRFLSL